VGEIRQKVDFYVQGVLDGNITTGELVWLACDRHASDIAQVDDAEYPYYLNDEAAMNAIDFVQNLKHVKGEWARANENIELEPWQLFILYSIFGWLHKSNDMRRFRTAYTEVARKNAKSTLTSAVGLYMMAADNEPGAECYSAATTRDQALIVFNGAQQMARKEKDMCKILGVDVAAHSIHQISTASWFRPLSADYQTLDGLNIHFAAVDELHAHKTRHVYDVIETATGSRQQSLVWNITTAGSNMSGVCYEQRSYVSKILKKTAVDDTYFGIIYTIDEDDEWTDPACWPKANPNLGVSVKLDDMERLARKAMEMPSAQNNFLTKRLNVWVNADTAWMNMLKWRACGNTDLSLEDFHGEPCIIAVDLASKIDIAAVKLLFKRGEHYYDFGKYYLPEEQVQISHNASYSGWVRSGYITTTEGNMIDFGVIEDDIHEICKLFDVEEICYDPYQATMFATRLANRRIKMVEYKQTVSMISEPMKEMEGLVMEGRFHHNGCPVMSWMVSNVVGHLDTKDNIYPRKEQPQNKIDGVVASIMALGRWMQYAPQKTVYSERQPLVLGG
jgi:phage terminase large subunit-like protein